MQYSNKHLIEVSCSFQFEKETTPWDSTFFGRFYDKIYSKGFTQKEQRQGLQINMGMDKTNPMHATSEIEEQIIFKNDTGMAIIMAKKKISFHVISNYQGWDNFVSTLIKPFSDLYKELGLGNGERQCNLIYLNRFTKPHTDSLDKYFTIIPTIGSVQGYEKLTILQRAIERDLILLIVKLNSQSNNSILSINFECGALSKEVLPSNDNWIEQATKTHKPVNEFFESIITEDLRKELKQ